MKYLSLFVLILFMCSSRINAASIPAHISIDLKDKTYLDLIETLAAACKVGVSIDVDLIDSLEESVNFNLTDAQWDIAVHWVKKIFQIEVIVSDKLLYARRYNASGDRIEKFYDVSMHVKSPLDHQLHPVDLPAMLYDTQGAVDTFPSDTDDVPDLSELVEKILSSVNPDSWSDEGVYIEEFYNRMVIAQTRENHNLIEKELLKLEHETARQMIGRLYQLDNLKSETELIMSAEQWAPLFKTCHAPKAVFIVLNNYQQNHFSGTQRTAIVSTDLFQGIHVPNVRVLSTGLSLCVQANATIAGVRVNTQLWATKSHEFPTTELASSDGTVLMNIVKPKITTDQCNDSRVIPNGGAAIYRFGDHAYALTMEVLDNRNK